MVATGLALLLSDPGRRLRGRRFGLVTNTEARGPDGRQGWQSLRDLCGSGLVALFSPEHGLDARHADAVDVQSTAAGGLPVHSLYGPGDRRAPEPWMLGGLDVLLFDLQDVGARFYTYLSTLVGCLRAAAPLGLPVLVLDRPNPLGGLTVEGPGLEPGYESFVGGLDVPVCHGLTIGELALLARRRLGLPPEAVEVVPAAGWYRDMSWEETGLVWYPPSPAATSLNMVRIYPGCCLVEGTNISEGRGTDAPFEIAGAPWFEARELARELSRLAPAGRGLWPSVAPAWFQPRDGKHAGVPCQGVRVSGPPRWPGGPGRDAGPGPVSFGVALLRAMLGQSGPSLAWHRDSSGRHWLDLLTGGPGVRTGLEEGLSWPEIAATWRERQAAHRAEVGDLLLYATRDPEPRPPEVAGPRAGPDPDARSRPELDMLAPLDLASALVAAAAEAVEAVWPAVPAIARAIELAAGRIGHGGRLIYAGAGTSGRLGALDASECGPTFGVDPGRVIALVAGGKEALARPREGAEDDTAAAERDVEEALVGPADVFVGVSASGATPYTVAALASARERGALTVAVVARPAASLARAAEVVIETQTGDEPLEGSTRLKAGTAQKAVLNALSTGIFAHLGHVHGNLMVGVQPVNAKLRRRAVGLVAQIAGVCEDRAAQALEAAGEADPRLAVRAAILALLRGLGPSEARDALLAAGGSLRRALSLPDPGGRA